LCSGLIKEGGKIELSKEQSEEELWFMQKLGLIKDKNDLGPGYLVEHKSGKTGRTYHSKGLINGKVPVYMEGMPPMLCKTESFKIIGFID